jgi:xylulokinase
VHARGVFFGLDADHGPNELAYAVVEGVAFGMAQGLAALRHAGSDVRRLGLVGGGARSTYWAQLHADVLGIEIQTFVGGAAGGALGAARLGALACGESETTVCTMPMVEHTFVPRADQRDLLQSRFGRFNSLYPRLADLFLP